MSLEDELARCRPWIEGALAYTGGTHEFEDVADAIREGRMQLWPAPKAAAVTELIAYPRKCVVNVFLAGGELEEVLAAIDGVADWARAQGCTGMTMTGRPGWRRVLEGRGWKQTMLTMERAA